MQSWDPLSLQNLASLFAEAECPFWIAGGFAIDLFIGHPTRAHEDLDVAISRRDQLHFQKLLQGWDLRVPDPPGKGVLREWKHDEFLELPLHNLWCRREINGSWNLELLFCDFTETEWIYRRNQAIRGPTENFGWKHGSGLQVIAPEIQLLYKSKTPREKDLHDLKSCLPHFSGEQKAWLKKAIQMESADHPWLKVIV